MRSGARPLPAAAAASTQGVRLYASSVSEDADPALGLDEDLRLKLLSALQGMGTAEEEPRKEPAQYPETEQGLYRMMKDWVVAHNYAIQTGDCSYAFKYITEDAEEYEFYLYIQGLYQRGGWTVDGLDSYQPEGPLIYDEAKKMYRMKHRRFWSTVMYVESNGHLTMQANTETSDDTFYFLFTYSDGYWKIAGSKSIEEIDS